MPLVYRKGENMKKEIAGLLNAQVNREFHSAYLYLGISKYFSRQDLPGFAAWYRHQAQEEQEHAMKLYDYLLDHDEDVELAKIAEASGEYKDAIEAVKAADSHEHYITAEILKLVEAAVEAKDYRTQLFLNWYVTEQEEEEKTSKAIVSKVELLGTSRKGLYLLDKEMGERRG